VQQCIQNRIFFILSQKQVAIWVGLFFMLLCTSSLFADSPTGNTVVPAGSSAAVCQDYSNQMKQKGSAILNKKKELDNIIYPTDGPKLTADLDKLHRELEDLRIKHQLECTDTPNTPAPSTPTPSPVPSASSTSQSSSD